MQQSKPKLALCAQPRLPSKSGPSYRDPEDVKDICRSRKEVALSCLLSTKAFPIRSRKMRPREVKQRSLIAYKLSRAPRHEAGPDPDDCDEPSTRSELGSSSSMVLGALVSPSIVYHFRLCVSRTYTASTTTVNGHTDIDPTLFQEWSTIDQLFDEYKVNRVCVNIIPMTFLLAGAGGTVAPYAACAINLGLAGANPGSINSVISVPNSRMISLAVGQPTEYYQFDSGNIGGQFMWQQIGAAVNEPYAGSYGSFIIYGTTLGNSDVVQAFFQMDFMVRCRA